MTSDVRERLRAYYDHETSQRLGRPTGEERTRHLQSFLAEVVRRGAGSVLEVGCGVGRDAVVIRDAGLRYTGVDLSLAAVQLCRERGLAALTADATALPLASASVDAAWSMSTLMHLPGDGLERALDELARVVRPGGLVEIGVWGHTEDREWTSPDGRYFRHRSDQTLRSVLDRLGTVLDFDTWARFDDGGHYQWARVVVGPERAPGPVD